MILVSQNACESENIHFNPRNIRNSPHTSLSAVTLAEHMTLNKQEMKFNDKIILIFFLMVHYGQSHIIIS